jgi:SPP1 gp7 family putative phage head morphogenesis protein
MSSKLFQLLGRNKSKDRARARKLAPRLPDTERVRYVAKLDVFWAKWEKRVFAELGLRRDSARSDALSPLLQASFNEILEKSDLGTFVDSVGDRITGKALDYMREVVRVPASVPGKEDMIAAFRKDNIALIKDVGAEQAKRLDEVFTRAGAGGIRNEELVREIQEALGAGQSRAELIARDQILKFNASVHEAAQRSAGIEEYIWSDSDDERTRESHEKLGGTRQRWDSPPIVDGEPAHPGEPVQCRCSAVPVVGLLDDI